MKLLVTWRLWTFIFVWGGVALTISDMARSLGLAPVRELHDPWFGGITFVVSFWIALLFVRKALEEGEEERSSGTDVKG
jgi:hypothetical protein